MDQPEVSLALISEFIEKKGIHAGELQEQKSDSKSMKSNAWKKAATPGAIEI